MATVPDLPTMINATGRTDDELEARSGISAAKWRALRCGALPSGAVGHWRPRSEIVENLARALDTTPPAIRHAIVQSGDGQETSGGR